MMKSERSLRSTLLYLLPAVLISCLVAAGCHRPPWSVGTYERAAEASPSPGPKRALWAWRPTFIESSKDADAFLDFSLANGIDTIFLFTSAERFLDEAENLRRFLGRAHGRGLTVHALNGDPEWIFPGKRLNALAFMEAVRRFNRESPVASRFDAIHLDVEPHALPDWKAGKHDEIIPQYLDFVRWARRWTDEAGMPLVLDIPFQFSRFEFGSSSLVGAVLGLVDEVVVMAYRHGPQEVIDSAQPVIEQAEAKGKRVWIGVSADPAHLRRSQAGPATASDLNEIILQVEGAFRGKSSFVGAAIHDYDRFLDLP